MLCNVFENIIINITATLGTDFSELLSELHTFSFNIMHFNMSSAKRRQFLLDLNVLTMAIQDSISLQRLSITGHILFTQLHSMTWAPRRKRNTIINKNYFETVYSYLFIRLVIFTPYIHTKTNIHAICFSCIIRYNWTFHNQRVTYFNVSCIASSVSALIFSPHFENWCVRCVR